MSSPQSQMPTGLPALADFRSRRSLPSALIFYAFYALIGMIVSGILGGIVSYLFGLLVNVTSFNQGFTVGLWIGSLISMLYSLAICAQIIRKRGAWQDMAHLAALVVTAILGFLIGPLGGVVPSALLLAKKDPEPAKVAGP